GTGCKNPQLVETSGHSTIDGFFFYRTTIVVQFTVKCDIPSKVTYFCRFSVFMTLDISVVISDVYFYRDSYQISWSIKHKDAYGRRYEIRVYDDDGYTELKKGLSRGPMLSTETVVLLLIIAVYSFAYRWKSSL
ncbi:unnamed protein product, partial [Soboliphyme baturini]|uniref:Translocon-associated protein subunit delta n=1 Tax=Soboliphyme baturini TaxID=241478 RepID=A0A183J283_9BILA